MADNSSKGKKKGAKAAADAAATAVAPAPAPTTAASAEAAPAAAAAAAAAAPATKSEGQVQAADGATKAAAGAKAGAAPAAAAGGVNQLAQMMAGLRVAPKETAAKDGHNFWKTQPMMDVDEKAAEHGSVEPQRTVEEVRQTPYNLPAGFSWDVIDIEDPAQRTELYNLLANNYVEDDENMFRFAYPEDFLLWAMTPPNRFPDWLVGVRHGEKKTLVGFISGIPVHTRVYTHKVIMCEINFLCVHKSLRSMRMAPVLIKEVTRRVNLRNIWQAVYTAGALLPTPVSACQYWHRSLNVKKLIDIGFSRVKPRMTLAGTIRLNKLPDTTSIPGLRVMTVDDVPAVMELLQSYLAKFDLVHDMDLADVKHWLVPRDGVVYSWVVQNPTTGKITDLCSFYNLPSSIIGHAKHSVLRAAYSFYNVPTSVSLKDLMQDLLVLAKNLDFDVMNALDLMENGTIMEDLKFGIGDGKLHFYLYNWRCPVMTNDRVGMVLL